MTRLRHALLGLLLTVGCKQAPPHEKSASPQPSKAAAAGLATEVASPPDTDAPSAAPVPTVPAAPSRRSTLDGEQAQAAAQALLQSWLQAQNAGTPQPYFGFYDRDNFRGVKRTRAGGRHEYDLSGWRKDRGRMFKRPMTVAAAHVEIKTWLDDDSKLRPGLTVVRFLQRFESGDYADHGSKVLMLGTAPNAITPRILREEMEYSRPGWEEGGLDEKLTGAIARAGPRLPGLLSSLELDLEDAQPFGAALPTGVADTVLDALMTMGSFECISHVAVERCGMFMEEWHDLVAGSAHHPCVRNRILVGLLPKASDRALSRHGKRLKEALLFERPDELLARAILDSAVKTDAAPSYLTTALGAPDELSDLVDGYIYEIEESARVGLWTRTQNLRVLDRLPVKTTLQHYLAAHTLQSSLPEELAVRAVGELIRRDDKKWRTQLVRFAKTGGCESSMLAADALAKLGDESLLPRWGKDPGFQLCRLVHDPDKARARRLLGKLFNVEAPPVSADIVDFEEDPWNRTVERAEDEPQPSAAELLAECAPKGAEATLWERVRHPKYTYCGSDIEVLDRDGLVALLLSAETDEFALEDGWRVGWEPGPGGHEFIDYVRHYVYEDRRCPC